MKTALRSGVPRGHRSVPITLLTENIPLRDSPIPLRPFGAAWLADEPRTQQITLGDARTIKWHEDVRDWPRDQIGP